MFLSRKRSATLLLWLLAASSALAVRPLFQRKKYTPLVFFTVPPGLIPECDAMERTVRQVEKELGVRVERLDILRNPSAEAVLALLTQRTPPFLYHRESCQVVHLPSAPGGGVASTSMPIFADKDRVRAWAKGRLLQTKKESRKTKVPVVISQQDNSISQEELLEEMSLTPQQLEGKRKIRERTEAKARR
jgi:anti-sigma factor ChrR (cupin superfamily)